MHFVADALVTALEKVLLYRLAHLQQHALQIDLMPCFDMSHGQFHDHHLIAIGVILDRALTGNLCSCLGQRLDLPTGWPGNAWFVR
ncbi:hypothetical protein D9M71_841210 [compost metagenome]